MIGLCGLLSLMRLFLCYSEIALSLTPPMICKFGFDSKLCYLLPLHHTTAFRCNVSPQVAIGNQPEWAEAIKRRLCRLVKAVHQLVREKLKADADMPLRASQLPIQR